MAGEVPEEYRRMLDEAAGKEHSASGPVMTCLADIVAKVRADERAKVAEEIEAEIDGDDDGNPFIHGMARAVEIARGDQ